MTARSSASTPSRSASASARPVLKALLGQRPAGQPGQTGQPARAGRAEAEALLDGVEAELRAIMLLTGSRDLGALRRAPRVISGELRAWLEELGQGTKVVLSKP
jgi:hypothetical protein